MARCQGRLSVPLLDRIDLLVEVPLAVLVGQRCCGGACRHGARTCIGWSGRGYHRVLKVAHSIAELAKTLQLRRGLP